MNTIIQYCYNITLIINTNRHTITGIYYCFDCLFCFVVLLLMFYLCFCANIRYIARICIIIANRQKFIRNTSECTKETTTTGD